MSAGRRASSRPWAAVSGVRRPWSWPKIATSATVGVSLSTQNPSSGARSLERVEDAAEVVPERRLAGPRERRARPAARAPSAAARGTITVLHEPGPPLAEVGFPHPRTSCGRRPSVPATTKPLSAVSAQSSRATPRQGWRGASAPATRGTERWRWSRRWARRRPGAPAAAAADCTRGIRPGEPRVATRTRGRWPPGRGAPSGRTASTIRGLALTDGLTEDQAGGFGGGVHAVHPTGPNVTLMSVI